MSTQTRTSLNTVYQRRGKWVVEYIDFEGKQKIKTLWDKDRQYPENKTHARRLADEFLVKIRSAENLQSEQEFLNRIAEKKQLIQRLKFELEDVLPMILSNPRLNNNTRIQNREFQWKKFYDWMLKHHPRTKSPHEITPLIAQTFMADLYKEGMANSTYNDYLCSYKMFFKIIMVAAGMNNNPFEHVERLAKNDSISHKPIPKEYIPKIIVACDDPSFEVLETRRLQKITKSELKTLVIVGLCSGMRLKDCALLDWANIDFERNIIQTVAYKTKKYNKGYLWIPMMSYLRNQLLNIHHGESSGAVMPLIASRYMDQERKKVFDSEKKSDNGNMHNEVKNLLRYVGLPTNTRLTKAEQTEGITINRGRRKKSANIYGFHSFRHFFVSTCAESNVPMAYVEAILGADSAVLKEYYTHINTDDMMRAIKEIECKFVGDLPQPQQRALTAG